MVGCDKLAREGKRAQRAHVAETQAANRERMAALTVSPVPFGPPIPVAPAPAIVVVDNVVALRPAAPVPAREASLDERWKNA